MIVPEWQQDILAKTAKEFHLTKGHVSLAVREARNHSTRKTVLEASLAYLLLYLRCSGGPRYSATPMKLFEDRSVQLASAGWQGSSAFTEKVFRRRIRRFYTEFRRLGVCPTYFPPSAEDLLKHVDLTKLRLPCEGRGVKRKAISLIRSSSMALGGYAYQPPTLAGGALYLASRILGQKNKEYRLTMAKAASLFGISGHSVSEASDRIGWIVDLPRFTARRHDFL